MVGIYKITNKLDGKVYIGQSINIQERWKAHKSRPFNPNSTQYDSPLYRAIRKYGLNNFSFEILEECAQDELNDKEIAYIKLYQSNDLSKGYNLTNGGQGIYQSDSIGKLSDQDVDKIYELLQDLTLSEQVIADQFDVSQRTISGINLGQYRARVGVQYPIRTRNAIYEHKKTKASKNYCCDCGTEISKNATRCVYCENKQRTSTKIVTREELKALIRSTPFTRIAEKYGVSDNAIRKWCVAYNLPKRASDIKKIDDETWKTI